MNRLNIYVAIILALVCSCKNSEKTPEKTIVKKPNVVIIFTDDQGMPTSVPLVENMCIHRTSIKWRKKVPGSPVSMWQPHYVRPPGRHS